MILSSMQRRALFIELMQLSYIASNLKIWDIRKKDVFILKRVIARALVLSNSLSTVFGSWVVSGGFDNVVKVRGLTAGMLLHDFKFHEGHIRSIDFDLLEFLLAIG